MNFLRDRRDPNREPLRRLVLAGNMMSAQLAIVADKLDASGQPEPERIERKLVDLWEQMLAAFLADLHIGPPPERVSPLPLPSPAREEGKLVETL